MYITVSDRGKTYHPKDDLPRWENFPYIEIAEHNGSWESLGASEDWQADPWGAPEEPRHIRFTAEGPDAQVAIQVIRGVLSQRPPASKVGIALASSTGMLKYLFATPTDGQRYRPPGYRPPSRPQQEPTRPKPRPRPNQSTSWRSRLSGARFARSLDAAVCSKTGTG